MRDSAEGQIEIRPRRICRKIEAHETAILSLAMQSLLAVKADKDASWPCRIRPLHQFAQLQKKD